MRWGQLEAAMNSVTVLAENLGSMIPGPLTEGEAEELGDAFKDLSRIGHRLGRIKSRLEGFRGGLTPMPAAEAVTRMEAILAERKRREEILDRADLIRRKAEVRRMEREGVPDGRAESGVGGVDGAGGDGGGRAAVGPGAGGDGEVRGGDGGGGSDVRTADVDPAPGFEFADESEPAEPCMECGGFGGLGGACPECGAS